MPDYVTFDIDKKRRKDQRNKLLSLSNEKKVQVLHNIKLYSFHPLTVWLDDLEENLTAEFSV